MSNILVFNTMKLICSCLIVSKSPNKEISLNISLSPAPAHDDLAWTMMLMIIDCINNQINQALMMIVRRDSP